MFDRIKGALSKFDEWLKYFVIIMLILSVFYILFVAIFRDKDDNEIVSYSDAEEFVAIYSDMEYNYNEKLVKNYNEYYTIKSATDNFITAIYENRTSDLYALLEDSLKKQYTKNEFNDVVTKMDEDFLDNYDIANYLKKVYKISTNQYICNIKYENFEMFIGIKLDPNNEKYTVFYLKIGE